MEFGIFMDFFSTPGLTQTEVFNNAFELADLAEETGLDSVWENLTSIPIGRCFRRLW
jgi:hypothetical protein